MSARVEISGKVFGGWTVLSYATNSKWLCRCQCGVIKTVDGTTLRSGASTRCRQCDYAMRRVNPNRKTPWLDLDLVERFWSKVDRLSDEECWPWIGLSKNGGYGQFKVHGRFMPAQRFSWMVANGRLFPEGLHACHSCDNPRCVNPSHIWPGTDLDNFRDSQSKGRWGGPAAANAAKVACSHGHPLTGDNLYVRPDGYRTCRTCQRVRCRQHMWDKRHAE